MLEETTTPIVEAHDLVMFDLDGVVYVGGTVVDGAAEHIDRVREAGCHVAFVTNNASRTPDKVAQKLEGIGVVAAASDVVTSAQAAARVLVDEHGAGAKVLLLGGEGLRVALLEAGLEPVDDPDGAVAVVSGYGPDVRWRDIMRVSTLVRDGLPYVASNTDMTIPTPYGLAPGHGVLVRTISGFAGVDPVVAGKPEKPLMEETVRRVGGDRPIMVGDRLDTDIEGAHAIGVPSLLVLTGVSWLDDLVAATPELRPTYISPTLEGLFEPHPVPRGVEGGGAELNGWSAAVDDGRLTVSGDGTDADWWRVVATVAWQHLDASGSPIDLGDTTPPGPVRRLGAE
jgi:HAD superfamily hydrolase (TIGR01450 family)